MAICCMDGKTIQCLPNPSQHVPIYFQQFPSYSNRKCKKIAVFRYLSPHFCFSWRRPCDYHAICSMDGKTVQCLPNPSQHIPIYVQKFRSYTILKSMRKSKNRYFYHIFVSPVDAPVAITLNVVWMEREFDAYKLSRCLCPSNYNDSEIERDIGRKSSFFHTPLHSTPSLGGFPSEYRPPFGRKKLEWCGYPMVKKTSKISLFVLTQLTNVTDRQTDGQTDRHRMPTYTALVHMHRAVKTVKFQTTCKRVLRTYCNKHHMYEISLPPD